MVYLKLAAVGVENVTSYKKFTRRDVINPIWIPLNVYTETLKKWQQKLYSPTYGHGSCCLHTAMLSYSIKKLQEWKNNTTHEPVYGIIWIKWYKKNHTFLGNVIQKRRSQTHGSKMAQL